MENKENGSRVIKENKSSEKERNFKGTKGAEKEMRREVIRDVCRSKNGNNLGEWGVRARRRK